MALDPTRRELEMLALHAQGMTNAEIGAAVFLSASGVYAALLSLRRKLGARNLYQAQILALAGGYLCIDGRTRKAFVPDSALEAIASSSPPSAPDVGSGLAATAA